MTEYRLSPLAEQDIETILEWTHEEFGEKARIRYDAVDKGHHGRDRGPRAGG